MPTGERDDDALAAEYVLGVLDQEERESVEIRIRTEAAFAVLVRDWEHRLSDLNSEFEEIPPPASVKAGVESKLFSSEDSYPGFAEEGGFWNRLGFWRGFAALAVVAVIVLSSLLVQQTDEQVAGVTYVAALSSGETDAEFVVLYEAETASLKVTQTGGVKPTGKDYELWFIDGDGPAISIGLVDGEGVKAPFIPDHLKGQYKEGLSLAVSLEPTGGSPTGVATGPVIAIGKAKKI